MERVVTVTWYLVVGMLERHLEQAMVKAARQVGGMTESAIERRVCQYAQSKGALAFKWVSPGTPGVCDRIFIYTNRVWFIEFKRAGLKPTPLQAKHHRDLTAMGMSVYVVDSVQQGQEVIDHELSK